MDLTSTVEIEKVLWNIFLLATYEIVFWSIFSFFTIFVIHSIKNKFVKGVDEIITLFEQRAELEKELNQLEKEKKKKEKEVEDAERRQKSVAAYEQFVKEQEKEQKKRQQKRTAQKANIDANPVANPDASSVPTMLRK